MKRYFLNILIAIDQLVNAVFFGYPDETLSARCWREQRWCRHLIDVLFFWQYDKFFGGHWSASFDSRYFDKIRRGWDVAKVSTGTIFYFPTEDAVTTTNIFQSLQKKIMSIFE